MHHLRIGAYFVQALAKKLDELLKMPPNYGAGKECNCAIALFAHLYNFKVGPVLIKVLIKVSGERKKKFIWRIRALIPVPLAC